MTKTLAEKTCTPCRDGIPPLTRNEGKQHRKPGEFVRRLIVPKLPPATHFRAYKITKRIDEDISDVLAAFCKVDGGRMAAEELGIGLERVHITATSTDKVPNTMWIVPLDAKLAMIYPPWCDCETIRRLDAIGYELIECPRDEIYLYPTNAITIEPRCVIMNATAEKTRRLLEKHKVEVITVEYDEVHKYGGGIRCNTMQLIRDPGPRTFV